MESSRAPLIVLVSLALLASVRPAHADIILTDTALVANQRQERQDTPATHPTASAPMRLQRLVDASGLEWFAATHVTFATSSSASGAVSDAFYRSALSATTAGGGTISSVLSDAFDGYNGVLVTVGGGTPVSYNQNGVATTECSGRQVVLNPQTIGGITVSRKVFVPDNDDFARWLTIFANPGSIAQTVVLETSNNLGSDARTKVVTTSDGDAMAEVTDTWVTTFEDYTAGRSPDPRLGHVLQGAGGSVALTSVTFADGQDTPSWSYSFSLGPGQTIIILNMATGQPSKAAAAAKAAALAAMPASAQQCLDNAEKTQIANFLAFVPTLTITAPTTAPSFVATSPFISLAGTATDDKGIASVTWTNNRGGSGTAIGTTSWSIPGVALQAGVNVITVTASDTDTRPGDLSGPLLNSVSATLTVTVNEMTYFLAEGATGTFFDLDILIANPNGLAAPVTATFLKENGTTIAQNYVLPPTAQLTIPVESIPGLENTAVSAVITSTAALPLVVERSMFWDSTYYGSHTGTAVDGARTAWLFGEGSQGFFDTYVLLANANNAPATVTVTFLTEFSGAVARVFTVAPTSRLNVYAGAIPELINKSFSIVVDSDIPIIAERAMYFGSPLFNGGHESTGVSEAATSWFHAEGATGTFFDTFILVGNPNATPATVTFTFLLSSGAAVVRIKSISPNSRLTVNVEDEDPLLASTAVSTTVTSDVPVISERAMYWTGGFTTWYEAHNSFGVTATATRWGLAEGRVGGPRGFETFILLANPNATAANVRITYLRPDGSTVVKDYVVGPTSRFNVYVNGDVPELADESFGAVIDVQNDVPIAVERAMYNNASGIIWAAGTNATATRLP